jgi:hypothetical protein
MAIKSKDTRETLERWQFDIHVEEPAGRVEGKENSAYVPSILSWY